MSKASERRRMKKMIDNLETEITSLKEQDAPEVAYKKLEDLKSNYEKRYQELAPKSSGGKKNKYNANKMIYNGEQYDSTREARMAQELDRYGVRYERQVKFELIPKEEVNGESQKARTMKVDFLIKGGDKPTIVDVKGLTTALSKFKYRLLMHQKGDEYQYLFPNTDEAVKSIASELGASFGDYPDGANKVGEITKPVPPKEDSSEEEGDDSKKESSKK